MLGFPRRTGNSVTEDDVWKGAFSLYILEYILNLKPDDHISY
jgi:hypothetical protein